MTVIPLLSPDRLYHLVTLGGCPSRPVPRDHGPGAPHVSRDQETRGQCQCEKWHDVTDHPPALSPVYCLVLQSLKLYLVHTRLVEPWCRGPSLLDLLCSVSVLFAFQEACIDIWYDNDIFSNNYVFVPGLVRLTGKLRSRYLNVCMNIG